MELSSSGGMETMSVWEGTMKTTLSTGTSFSMGGEMLSLGGDDFWSIVNWSWTNKVEWSSVMKSWSSVVNSWSWTDWEVGSGYTESVDWISYVVDVLDKAVAIDVRVTSTGDAVSGANLAL